MNNNPLFNFMNSVTNRRAKEKAATEESAKQKDLTSKARRASYAPLIALTVANLIILTLDYRVFDAVYKITDSYVLAGFSIIPTGAMFILWFDVLYSAYPLAIERQKQIALACSGLALFAAGVFAFFDYGVTVDMGRGVKVAADYDFIFWATIVLSIIHAVALFVWFAIDEDTIDKKANERDLAAQRRKAEAQEAQGRITLEMMETANRVLSSMEGAMKKQRTLEDTYGAAEVGKMLALLAGVEMLTGQDLNGDGRIGNAPAMNVNQQTAQDVTANFPNPSTAQTKK